MKVINTISAMREQVGMWKLAGNSIAFVPTMGAFHEGHLTLMRSGKQRADRLVVSLFVNPTQFGENEDLTRYPRDLAGDSQKARDEGVDVLFCPEKTVMYPAGHVTHVKVDRLTDGLCGASRPVHFGGVATIVTKLLNIVQPDCAIFGLKDYQQFRVVSRMVEDLDIPTVIVPGATVREHDGVAMSSRNLLLSAAHRRSAPCLNQALRLARQLYHSGERDVHVVKSRLRELIEAAPDARIDYVEIVHPLTLQPLDTIEKDGAQVALAVFIGSTRLIDNTRVDAAVDSPL